MQKRPAFSVIETTFAVMLIILLSCAILPIGRAPIPIWDITLPTRRLSEQWRQQYRNTSSTPAPIRQALLT